MKNFQKEQISIEVIRTLASRFENFPEDASKNRNAPFHTAFLNAFSDKLKDFDHNIPFFISLASWLHGLNTTLGQSFFERTAHILSGGEKKSFTRGNRLPILKQQTEAITKVITDLKNRDESPNVTGENSKIFISEGDAGDPVDFTADVFYVTDKEVVAIELKSVNPNAGEVRGEKQKILEAKASLKNSYPDLDVKFFIGFPFDPTGESDFDYDKERFLSNLIDGHKYLDPNEILLGPELWEYLASEEGTMEKLISIINDIAKPDFLESIEYLNNNYMKLDDKEYLELLTSWNLFREIDFRTEENINKVIKSGNTTIERTFKQDIIKMTKSSYGYYNENRMINLELFLAEYQESGQRDMGL